ncbi:MAG TPA: hypothetical protein VLG69_00935 [Candidatus Andersenbacteria bacterium]|nr:hypothetical protein [Candidatus Andersenbacteria bacterium]
MLALLALFIGGSVLTLGDILFKYYVEKPNAMLYGFGLIMYIIGLIFLIESFKTENIAVASTIFVIINITTLFFVSLFLFKEHPTPLQIAGILLAFVAIALLE